KESYYGVIEEIWELDYNTFFVPLFKCKWVELTNVPAITQSEVEKDKADIRKRLHLLKEDIDLRSEAVRSGYYRWMDREDCTMPQFVDFKKEIFLDAHDFTLPINTTDIIELLAGDKLGTNILTLFLRW
ncbi:hypothetical protein Tco_0207423, partial [Tanacetum coccineum]